MDEMCKRSDRDFPGLQALESLVDGILARAKEEKLKPITLIDSWSQGAPPPKQKAVRKVGFCCMFLYVFSSLQRVVLFFSLDFATFLFVLGTKTCFFFSVSLSLSLPVWAFRFNFFVLQLIGFHTCKRYCLQEKEHKKKNIYIYVYLYTYVIYVYIYIWESDHRNVYTNLLFSIWFSDLHMYLNHNYVGFEKQYDVRHHFKLVHM